MLKQLVQWEGFDGKQRSKTFYFNLTRYEVSGEMELEVLEQRSRKFLDEVTGDDERQMTPAEIREVLDMIKIVIRYAYGEYRETPDGAEIWKDKQDPNVWNRFVASGGFDAFIWYLFEDPKRVNHFMTNIWPKDLREAIEKMEGAQDATDGIPSITSVPDISSNGSVERGLPDYSDSELLSLSDDEFDGVVTKFREGNNIPSRLLVIGGQRMNRGEDQANA